MLFDRKVTLLSVPTMTSEDQVGSIVKLKSASRGGQSYSVSYTLTQTNTQSSTYQDPNQTVLYVETSFDAVSWVDAMPPEIVAANVTISKTVLLSALMEYVRARTDVSGPDKPSHTATVVLVSNGDLQHQVVV